jgi:hypothetical protein
VYHFELKKNCKRSNFVAQCCMPNRSGKKQDLNEKAFSIVQQLTGQTSENAANKNPAAVELGRLGGLKGGKARAAKLTAKQRTTAARKAARARWSS